MRPRSEPRRVIIHLEARLRAVREVRLPVSDVGSEDAGRGTSDRSPVDQQLDRRDLHVVERPSLDVHGPARARHRVRRLEHADRPGRVAGRRVGDREPPRRVAPRRVEAVRDHGVDVVGAVRDPARVPHVDVVQVVLGEPRGDRLAVEARVIGVVEERDLRVVVRVGRRPRDPEPAVRLVVRGELHVVDVEVAHGRELVRVDTEVLDRSVVGRAGSRLVDDRRHVEDVGVHALVDDNIIGRLRRRVGRPLPEDSRDRSGADVARAGDRHAEGQILEPVPVDRGRRVLEEEEDGRVRVAVRVPPLQIVAASARLGRVGQKLREAGLEPRRQLDVRRLGHVPRVVTDERRVVEPARSVRLEQRRDRRRVDRERSVARVRHRDRRGRERARPRVHRHPVDRDADARRGRRIDADHTRAPRPSALRAEVDRVGIAAGRGRDEARLEDRPGLVLPEDLDRLRGAERQLERDAAEDRRLDEVGARQRDVQLEVGIVRVRRAREDAARYARRREAAREVHVGRVAHVPRVLEHERGVVAREPSRDVVVPRRVLRELDRRRRRRVLAQVLRDAIDITVGEVRVVVDVEIDDGVRARVDWREGRRVARRRVAVGRQPHPVDLEGRSRRGRRVEPQPRRGLAGPRRHGPADDRRRRQVDRVDVIARRRVDERRRGEHAALRLCVPEDLHLAGDAHVHPHGEDAVGRRVDREVLPRLPLSLRAGDAGIEQIEVRIGARRGRREHAARVGRRGDSR